MVAKDSGITGLELRADILNGFTSVSIQSNTFSEHYSLVGCGIFKVCCESSGSIFEKDVERNI